MGNIATTVEQSKHLLELGLDPATSDMWWIDDQLVAKSDKFDVPSNDEETTVHCAWSLTALLELVPKNLLPTLEWRDGENEWEVNVWVDHNIHSVSHYDKECAAYEMVCWLLTNNLITNN